MLLFYPITLPLECGQNQVSNRLIIAFVVAVVIVVVVVVVDTDAPVVVVVVVVESA